MHSERFAGSRLRHVITRAQVAVDERQLDGLHNPRHHQHRPAMRPTASRGASLLWRS